MSDAFVDRLERETQELVRALRACHDYFAIIRSSEILGNLAMNARLRHMSITASKHFDVFEDPETEVDVHKLVDTISGYYLAVCKNAHIVVFEIGDQRYTVRYSLTDGSVDGCGLRNLPEAPEKLCEVSGVQNRDLAALVLQALISDSAYSRISILGTPIIEYH